MKLRPHVEIINECDYVWHVAELPASEGKARQRNLCIDEETGASSLRIDFSDNWSRQAGWHEADVEFYVMEGSLTVGGHKLERGGYLQVPKGALTPAMNATAGTKLLYFVEGGGVDFTPAGGADRRATREAQSLTLLDTEAMEWAVVGKAGPAPGLMIKMLHEDPKTGFYTRLIWVKPEWVEEKYEHHACFEEAYILQGTTTYNFGQLRAGSYFFRPPYIKHGGFVAAPDGHVALIRSDKELTNWYTTDPVVTFHGTPVNYDPAVNGPILSSRPLRSRSHGPWDGSGM